MSGRSTPPRRPDRRAARALLLVALGLACSEADAPPPAASRPVLETATVVVAGEAFEVEVAIDPMDRMRGLSGRTAIPRNGGMLFVLPKPQPMSMVMRDCPVPIDVAFIDAMGRVVAIHEMTPEPPREPGEFARRYELRLREYPSGDPIQFALETAGGRLAELGLHTGDRLHFPARDLIERANEFDRVSESPAN
jgi:hypothetical protein